MNKEIIGDSEILSLITQNNHISNAPWFDLENMLTEQECKIHSIKKISTGEVFTLGDRVTYKEDKDTWIISGMSINNDINQIMLNAKVNTSLRDTQWCSINTKNLRKHE